MVVTKSTVLTETVLWYKTESVSLQNRQIMLSVPSGPCNSLFFLFLFSRSIYVEMYNRCLSFFCYNC